METLREPKVISNDNSIEDAGHTADEEFAVALAKNFSMSVTEARRIWLELRDNYSETSVQQFLEIAKASRAKKLGPVK